MFLQDSQRSSLNHTSRARATEGLHATMRTLILHCNLTPMAAGVRLGIKQQHQVKGGRAKAKAFIIQRGGGTLWPSPTQALQADRDQPSTVCFTCLATACHAIMEFLHCRGTPPEVVVEHLCMVGRMKSMEAMKPFTAFMMVLKMYTKECLQCISERLSLLDTAPPVLWFHKRLVAHAKAKHASLSRICFRKGTEI